MNHQGRLSGKKYWSEKYRGELPRAVDLDDKSVRNYFRRYYHREFSKWLKREALGPGSQLIEVGCGGSIWLPYFARTHAFHVTGLDYSEAACAASEKLLRREGVRGSVICADLFEPPAELRAAFDIVMTNGVVEHFESPSAAIVACARLLRPGGLILTIIPNLAGLSGVGLRYFNPQIYDIHVPLTLEQLSNAHAEARLDVLHSEYLVPMWFSDWDVPPGERRKVRRLLRNALWYSSAALSVAVWKLDDLIGNRLPGSRLLSPWCVCWAKKPI